MKDRILHILILIIMVFPITVSTQLFVRKYLDHDHCPVVIGFLVSMIFISYWDKIKTVIKHNRGLGD